MKLLTLYMSTSKFKTKLSFRVLKRPSTKIRLIASFRFGRMKGLKRKIKHNITSSYNTLTVSILQQVLQRNHSENESRMSRRGHYFHDLRFIHGTLLHSLEVKQLNHDKHHSRTASNTDQFTLLFAFDVIS